MSERNIPEVRDQGTLSKPSCSRRNPTNVHTNECMTNVESVVLTQRWTVSNFDSLLKLSKPGCCLRSTVFKDDTVPEACWQLCLYPGGKRQENADHVSLFLKMSSTSPAKEVVLKAEYRFYFLDDKEEPKFSNVNIGEFHAKPPKGGHSWGLRNIPIAKVRNSIRADKSLVISCHIELIPDASKVPCKRVPIMPIFKVPFVQVPTSYVERELEMLANGEGTDMTIVAGSEEESNRESFRVHAYKLRAHSDVFQMMLNHEQMIENQEKRIEIKDFSPVAVRAMIEFIYAGVIKTEILVSDAVDVMQIAEKYQIMALKMTCEQNLLDRINVNNVLDCIYNAEKYNTAILYDACVDYAVHNRTLILALPAWRTFISDQPIMANQLLEKMVTANDTSPPTKKSRV